MCQMEAQLRTKTTEVKRLAEALDASEASAAAARSAAGVALKQESTAMGELAAARLQVGLAVWDCFSGWHMLQTFEICTFHCRLLVCVDYGVRTEV